jgi:hypothetical protein
MKKPTRDDIENTIHHDEIRRDENAIRRDHEREKATGSSKRAFVDGLRRAAAVARKKART